MTESGTWLQGSIPTNAGLETNRAVILYCIISLFQGSNQGARIALIVWDQEEKSSVLSSSGNKDRLTQARLFKEWMTLFNGTLSRQNN